MTGLTRRSLLAIPAALAATSSPPPLETFAALFDNKDRAASDAAKTLAAAWNNGYAIIVVELLRAYMAAPSDETRTQIANRAIAFLEKQTRKSFGLRIQDWDKWIWSQPYNPHPNYAEFKGHIYSLLDPRMRDFFPAGVKSEIRLDQVEWGGVKVNGIPPLDHPNPA